MLDREDPRKVEALFRAVGMVPGDFSSVRQAQTQEEAEQQLKQLKMKFKAGFKKVTLELHPDRNDGDPVKSELLRVLVVLGAHVEKLKAPRITARSRGVTVHYWPAPDGVTHQVRPYSADTVAAMTPTGVRWVRVR